MTPADITAAFDRIRQEMARIDPIAPLTPADREFAWLAQAYRHASESERGTMRALAPMKDSPLFWALTSRAAELALWDSDPAHLEDVLAGHCIEDFKLDSRENLRGLPFIWYAAEQLNSSAETLFAEAAKLASPRAREFLGEFAGRPLLLPGGGLRLLQEEPRSSRRDRPQVPRRIPKCAGRMKILAVVMAPTSVRRILKHLGLLTEAPQLHAARGYRGFLSRPA
jgi:hypothetical protein